MNRRPTWIPAAAALAVATAVALAVALGVAPPSGAQTGARAPVLPSATGERIDGVAATVNDEVILRSEVDEQVYMFLMQNRIQPDSLQVEQLRKEVLDRLIDEKVIVSEAKRLNITANPAEVDQNVDKAIADARERIGSPEAFAAELAKEGITEADLRKRYRDEISRQMLASQLLRKQLASKAEVTPAEASAYFTAHPDEFPKRPSAIRVQLVQMPVEADSARKAAVRAKAQAARTRVTTKGEPFSRVAQELSEDGTARNGGDLGWFKRGTLDSTFEAAAFKVPVGQVSEVVETPFGYHIIKVEEEDKAKGEIHARHILFRADATQADADRVKKRIDDVRAQATKGVDFGTLARRYSKYKGPATAEGDLGFLPMTVFSPEFRAALDTLETGQVSVPLLNAQGWHLFKVNDREAERAYKLDEIQQELPDLVKQAKQRKQYETYVADLRKKATIEYR